MKTKMKHTKILTFMPTKWTLSLLIILILSSTSKCHSQTQSTPSAELFCISDCETCPVICSPPPHSSPPPLILKLPPPPVHHYSPPQQPDYFTSPSPSSPPAHPPPPPRPSVYVYNPGTTPPSGSGQRNFSYPYYYFYASEASCNYLSPSHQGPIVLTFFIFFRILNGY